METIDKVLDILNKHGSSVDLSWDDPEIKDIFKDLRKARVRLDLVEKHKVVVDVNMSGRRVKIYRTVDFQQKQLVQSNQPVQQTTPAAKPKVKRTTHSYVPPYFHRDIVDALLDEVPHNIWFVGPTGTGKGAEVSFIAKELGRKVYRINCRQDMDSATFLGDKTIDIDQKSGQNFIRFVEGQIPLSMKEGLDDKGNEVGAPSILFVDEAGALPPHQAILLNRALENTGGYRREVALDADGGRVVRAHSGWRVVFAANTIGRGLMDLSTAGYAAQTDSQDISLLNRVTAVFLFGYNKSAEMSILKEKIGDDVVIAKIIKFRDIIRGHIKQGKLSTPFSTRTIIDVADMFRVWNGEIAKVFYYCVFRKLLPEEISVYNETAMAAIGKDVLRSVQNVSDMDFM